MTLWTNSQTANTLIFRIEKLFQENRESLAAAKEHKGPDENVISRKITDPAELAALKRQIPELLISEKLVKGNAFSFAEVNRWKNGKYVIIGILKNQ